MGTKAWQAAAAVGCLGGSTLYISCSQQIAAQQPRPPLPHPPVPHAPLASMKATHSCTLAVSNFTKCSLPAGREQWRQQDWVGAPAAAAAAGWVGAPAAARTALWAKQGPHTADVQHCRTAQRASRRRTSPVLRRAVAALCRCRCIPVVVVHAEVDELDEGAAWWGE